MNNLHRELAPISDSAWAEIETEASRTLKRYLAGRRVVDVQGPKGDAFAAVATGRLHAIADPCEGVQAALREAQSLLELCVPFELSRAELDGVERGLPDPDLQPLKDAARALAYAEDRAVFDGCAAAGIDGLREAASNPALELGDGTAPAAIVADAIGALRLAGVDGPYTLVLGEPAYTALAGARQGGYPSLRHVRELVNGNIVCAPAITGGVVLSTRGGDAELYVGQDASIGYASHTADAVRLYFRETFTFRVLTSEAAVALRAGG